MDLTGFEPATSSSQDGILPVKLQALGTTTVLSIPLKYTYSQTKQNPVAGTLFCEDELTRNLTGITIHHLG